MRPTLKPEGEALRDGHFAARLKARPDTNLAGLLPLQGRVMTSFGEDGRTNFTLRA